MCQLCDPETKEYARKGHRRMSEQFRRLAGIYEQLAAGRIDPHSREFADALKSVGLKTLAVELVEML